MLKRLEAAASRLEDVVLFAERRRDAAVEDEKVGGEPAKREVDSVSSTVSPRSTQPFVVVDGPPMPELGGAATPPPGLAALEAVKTGPLAEYVKISKDIAPGVAAQADAFAAAFAEMLKIVNLSARARKPEMEQFVQLLQPVNEAAAKVEAVRDEYFRERALANFLATVPAGVGAFGWVTISGKNQPASFIAEMKDSAQFYANRALKDHKDAKPWVQSFLGVLSALSEAVKTDFPEGLVWNPQGVSALEAASSAGAAGAATPAAPAAPAGPAGGPAPPPPPPPPSVAQLTADSGPAPAPTAPAAPTEGGGMNGVFAELSQGESISTGLKPKSQSLKASKPPLPKSTKPKPKGEASAAPAAGATAVTTAAKPLRPRVELVESTYYVEDLRDRHDIEIAAGIGQSVRIDNCQQCTIKITGKAAMFNMSRCAHVGLMVENMVASCDIVNCTNFGLQVTGTLPSLMLDQAAQGHIYLSKESLGLDLFTSQTSTININIPEDEEGAFREVPLGEQIVHNIVNGGVKSSVVKHG